MENVPDMALDREMFILRSIVRRLEDFGYSVQERVVDTYRYGVPQFRQRLILVALLGGLEFAWPAGVDQEGHPRKRDPRPPAGRPEGGLALGDDAHGWREYERPPQNEFQREMRAARARGPPEPRLRPHHPASA